MYSWSIAGTETITGAARESFAEGLGQEKRKEIM